jgi:hypothetical protein
MASASPSADRPVGGPDDRHHGRLAVDYEVVVSFCRR